MKKIVDLSKKYDAVQNIMPNVNEKTLIEAYWIQPDSAIKMLYGENLEENIQKLLCRMKEFSYYPQSRPVYSESNSDERDSKLEFGAFEDEIVADVFRKILEAIYSVKGCLSISPEFTKMELMVCSKHKRIPSLWPCAINLSKPMDNAENGRLTAFLQENIADRNFMRYIKRFLSSGIAESGNMLEADSKALLSSILIKIYCYHMLKEWLISKKAEISCRMCFCIAGNKFLFLFSDLCDESRIRSMLLREQSKLEPIVVRRTGYRFERLKEPSQKRNLRKIRRPVMRMHISNQKGGLPDILSEREIEKQAVKLIERKKKERNV